MIYNRNIDSSTHNKYAVSFAGNDKDTFDTFISIVNNDEGLSFKNQKWIISSATKDKLEKSLDPDSYFIENAEDTSSPEVGKFLKLNLYPYQKDIVEFCLKKGKGIIVAPCGSGKSPCGISLFLDAKAKGLISPDAIGLIVVKASLKYQWYHEVPKFSDLKANIIDTYKSTKPALHSKLRSLNKKLEPYLKDAELYADDIAALDEEISKIQEEINTAFESNFGPGFDLLITNYETLRDEHVRKKLHKLKLEYIMADEVQYIKSDTSARSKALCEFGNIKMRFGATATPIQKNPLDAYGITKFVSPGTFKSKSSFSMRFLTFSGFGRVSGSKNEKELNKILSDFMIVKTKEEVSKQLPNLVPITRYCKLTPKQREMTEQLLQEINDLKEQEKAIRLKLGQASENNEELLGIEANIMARQTFASELADSEELLLTSDSDLAKKYVTNSPSNKISLLLDTLEEILESGEKAAIFSKYRKMQPILTKAILERFSDIKIAYVNGSLSSEERFVEVYDKFSKDDNYRILLLSDAGAEGLNLSQCKYLIELEPADSYLIQTQRRGRVERSDSIHDTVFSYQLIAEDSYDEIGLKIIEKKERYDAQIIKGNLD